MRAILTLALLTVIGACDRTKSPEPPAAPAPASEPEPETADPDKDALAAKLPLHLVGSLDIPGSRIEYFARLELVDGALAGKLSIPQQGARDVPLAKIMFSEETVTFQLEKAGAVWTGTFKGDAIECAFTQGGINLDCSMETVTAEEYAEVAKGGRPQDPKPPFPYDAEDVEYENPKAKIKLAGTLTLPKGKGPHPTVLFISGSGPQDRNETILGHKPFWVLADHLARKGVGALRVDDRGVGGSGGDTKSVTMKDFAQDVEAGLAFLGTRARVDKKKIGLLGHSEGGAIAPYVAARRSDVAFVVMLAGPGVDGGEVLVEQVGALAKAMGADEATIKQRKEIQRKMMAVLRSTKDDAKAREGVRKLFDPQGTRHPQVEAQLDVMVSPWFRTFVGYDPAPTRPRRR